MKEMQSQVDKSDVNADLRPDIVIVVADDLGHGDLSCYGATAFKTSVIDRLAEKGLRFSDAHAASAVCTPSRYSLLTGRYPWRSPLTSGVLGGTDGALIASNVPTLAQVLQRNGYHTAAIGKWHLGLDWRLKDGTVRQIEPGSSFHPSMEGDGWDVDYTLPFDNGPTQRGFDRFFGISGSLDMPPYCYLQGDRVETVPDVPKSPLVSSQRPGPAAAGWRDDEVDPRFGEEAVRWLNETTEDHGRGSPRFLYLATSAPHRPCVPSPEFVGASGVGPRADSILMIDQILEQVLAALEGSNRPRIVVFTSDNGAPTRYSEDGLLEDHAPNGDLRGQKADVYDGGHRVPLIVTGDGLPEGVDDRLVSQLDLMPSLLKHLGIEHAGDTGLDGADDLFGSPVGGEQVRAAEHARVLGATAFDGSLVLMRQGETAIYSTGSGGFSEPVGEPTSVGGDRGQFYDRTVDPAQTTDLWEQRVRARSDLTTLFVQRTGYGDTDDQLR